MGPVQLLIVGFPGDEFSGKIGAELERLREHDTIRLLDLVMVTKEEGARIRVAEFTPSQGGDGGGTLAMRLLDGADVDLSHLDGADPEDLWHVTDEIPEGVTAAVALIEHRWAIPLRDAIRGDGGVPIADAWLAPEDAASIGLDAG